MVRTDRKSSIFKFLFPQGFVTQAVSTAEECVMWMMTSHLSVQLWAVEL